MFAAQQKLGHLCLIVDYNKIQSLGNVKDICDLSPLSDKFKAFNWNVIEIDGHNYNEIESAIKTFKNGSDRPTAIIANTITADSLLYGTGANTFGITALSALARTLIGKANAADMRSTLSAAAASHSHSVGDITNFASQVITAIGDQTLSALGVRYSITTNGYICFGDLFGGLILQWQGYFPEVSPPWNTNKEVIPTLGVQMTGYVWVWSIGDTPEGYAKNRTVSITKPLGASKITVYTSSNVEFGIHLRYLLIGKA
jgi:hypothetical protein